MVLEPKYFSDKNKPSWNSVILLSQIILSMEKRYNYLGGAVQAQQV